jgi:tripeptide aminopeptidase
VKNLSPVTQRFLRYVAYDTQSSQHSDSYPSTVKQKVLLELLRDELQELGLQNVIMDKYGYVTGTLPSNLKSPTVPVIGLIAHVDTSPDVSGSDVKPQVHRKYDGGPIKLNRNVTLNTDDSPLLNEHKGETIITSDGTTLLGADDKAGIAEIMTAIERLREKPVTPHGTLRIAFTPDEEVGDGTKFFDVKNFGAEYASSGTFHRSTANQV